MTYQSPWIDIQSDNNLALKEALAIDNFSFTNLYKFHLDILSLITQSQTLELIQEFHFKPRLELESFEQLVSEHTSIQDRIKKLNNDLKHALEFGDKVSIKQNIVDEEEKLKNSKIRIRDLVRETK